MRSNTLTRVSNNPGAVQREGARPSPTTIATGGTGLRKGSMTQAEIVSPQPARETRSSLVLSNNAKAAMPFSLTSSLARIFSLLS